MTDAQKITIEKIKAANAIDWMKEDFNVVSIEIDSLSVALDILADGSVLLPFNTQANKKFVRKLELKLA